MLVKKAFTLSELLVALAILGVVAAFTVPKVLEANQNAKRKAVFIDTIAILSQMAYTGKLNGKLKLHPTQVLSDTINVEPTLYYLNTVNAAAVCPNDMLVEGCRRVPYGIYAPDPTFLIGKPGFVLPTGATVLTFTSTDFSLCGYPTDNGEFQYFIIDWNGDQPPNQFNEDTISLWANNTDIECQGFAPGQVAMSSMSTDDDGRTLYESLFLSP